MTETLLHLVRVSALLAAAWLAGLPVSPASAEDAPFEQLLRDRGIGLDRDGLVEFLERQVVDPAGDRVERLIRQLGSDDFAVRAAATKELAAMPDPPVEALTKAAKSADPEIRERARRILRSLGAHRAPVLYAALKTIRRRRLAGTAAAILRVFPECERHHLRVAAREALCAAARADDAGLLRRVAAGENVEVREAAAAALERLAAGGADGAGRASDPFSRGLIVYLPFDGDAGDVSGFNNHGQPAGRVEFAEGGIGRFLRLDGTDSPGHILVPNSERLQTGDVATIACWYRVNQAGVPEAHDALVVRGSDRTGFAVIALRKEVRSLNFVTRNGRPDKVDLRYPLERPVGRWMHAAVVTGKDGTRVYSNGRLAESSDSPIDLAVANRFPLHVGILWEFSRFWFPLNGGIDEVRVYDRGLSAGEIGSLYAMEVAESAVVVALKRLGGNLEPDEHGDIVSVSLAGTRAVDADLSVLKRLHQLERLELSGTGITDAGLKHLRESSSLKRLQLHGTQVTDAGLRELVRVLPGCEIERD